jgi:hypothetical protein
MKDEELMQLFHRVHRVMVSMAGVLSMTAAVAAGQTGPPASAPQPTAPAQAGAPGQQGPGGGRGGFGRRAMPVVPYDDYTGFIKLWDGRTFTNWDGEADVWSIVDGTIHADTTKTPGQHHIHYTGPGAVMRDFDLKVEVKLSATGANGGIQYRGRLLHQSHGGSIGDPLGKPLPEGVKTFEQAIAAGIATRPAPRDGGPGAGPSGQGAGPGAAGGSRAAAPAAPNAQGGRGGVGTGPVAAGAPGRGRGGPTGPNGPTSEPNPWQVSGYQFDMDSSNGFTGQLYEGQGRGIVTPPGSIVELLPGRLSAKVGTVSDNPAALVKPHDGVDGEWNQIEIIARGNTLVHIINGKVVSVTIDDNPDFRAFQGILSLQLEGNGQIWYRNVYVKPL